MNLTREEVESLLGLGDREALLILEDSIIKITYILTNRAGIDDIGGCNNWISLQTGVSLAKEELSRYDQDDGWKQSIANCADNLREAQNELNELIDTIGDLSGSDTKDSLKNGIDRYFQKLNVVFKDKLELGKSTVSYDDSDYDDDDLDTYSTSTFGK